MVTVDTVLYPALVVGNTYRFKVQATNSYGDSDYSEETRAALGALPAQPNSPYKIEKLSSKSSIAVAWD